MNSFKYTFLKITSTTLGDFMEPILTDINSIFHCWATPIVKSFTIFGFGVIRKAGHFCPTVPINKWFKIAFFVHIRIINSRYNT
jgi:hypothetical protein